MTLTHRLLMLAAVSALALGTAACQADANPESNGGDPAPPASPQDPRENSPPAASQSDADPCALLTIAEMESAVGPGIEKGGLGQEVPGSCTFSIKGDVAAGAVRVTVGSPRMCDSIEQSLGAPEGAGGTRVDVGDGGLVAPQGGLVTFLVEGGCVTITASESDIGLKPDTMLALAEAAAAAFTRT